MNKYLLL